MDNWLLFGTVGGVEKQFALLGVQHESEVVEVTADLDFWETLVNPGDLLTAVSAVPDATGWRLQKV